MPPALGPLEHLERLLDELAVPVGVGLIRGSEPVNARRISILRREGIGEKVDIGRQSAVWCLSAGSPVLVPSLRHSPRPAHLLTAALAPLGARRAPLPPSLVGQGFLLPPQGGHRALHHRNVLEQ